MASAFNRPDWNYMDYTFLIVKFPAHSIRTGLSSEYSFYASLPRFFTVTLLNCDFSLAALCNIYKKYGLRFSNFL